MIWLPILVSAGAAARRPSAGPVKKARAARSSLLVALLLVFRPAQAGSVATQSRILEDFAQMQAAGFRASLDRIRIPDLSPEARERIRAALPGEGEIYPSRKGLQRLAALQPILQYHRRAGLIEVKIVEASQARTGLHARSFLLISKPAFRLLDTEELEALAAHEMGHDYFWNEYEQARDNGDFQRAQEIELRCDAVAVFTLADLGLEPRKLLSAVDKLADFNSRFRLDARMYVPHDERLRFIAAAAILARQETGQRRSPVARK